MPETTRVGGSRAAAIGVAMVMLSIGGLIALSWTGRTTPAPTLLALASTPTNAPESSSPTASPTKEPTDPPTPKPTPTASPTLRPSPTPRPLPTSHPAADLADVWVLTTAQFARLFNSGEHVGGTFVVHGRIDAAPDILGDTVPDGSLCADSDACPYGVLADATSNGGTRPLVVWSRAIARPLLLDERADKYYWPRARTPLPVEAELVLRIDTTYSVEYLGRAVVDQAGDVWGPRSVAALDKSALALDQVLLVDGWLGQGTINVECTGEDFGPLPRHFCGHESWIAESTLILGESDLLGVQPDAYALFAPDAQPSPAFDAYVPQRGIMAVGPRLERDGCDAPPCPSWTVVGWLKLDLEPWEIDQAAIPPEVSGAGWAQLDVVGGQSAQWSPDGSWLLVTAPGEIQLYDARTGLLRQRWERRTSGQAIWIDAERFLVYDQPEPPYDVTEGTGAIGEAGSRGLRPVSLPVVNAGLGAAYVAPLAGGNRAIAFSTTLQGIGDCGEEGCFEFVIWTPGGTSDVMLGLPIAWSPSGDRLALLHNDDLPARRGLGAGFHGRTGWLEVISWPSLERVYANRHVLVDDVSAFDPTGRWLASAMGPTKVVNLDTDRTRRVAAWGWPPVWGCDSNLFAVVGNGDVSAIDRSGESLRDWPAIGNQLTGTADGSRQVAMLWDPMRTGPMPVFTLLQPCLAGGTPYSFALPGQEPDSDFWEQAISPDGRAFYVWVSRSTTRQLYVRQLP